jgi:hydrogenase/urease accessory protein HupE
MYDVLYIAVIVAFFGLMLGFVHGLAVLGRDAATDDQERP